MPGHCTHTDVAFVSLSGTRPTATKQASSLAAQGQGFPFVEIQVGKLLASLLHGIYLHKCKHSDIGKINRKVEMVGGKATKIKKKKTQNIDDSLVVSV